MKKRVKDLEPGDYVDLKGDKYDDPEDFYAIFEEYWQVVSEVVPQTPNFTLVKFQEISVGFPPEHEVQIKETVNHE